MAETIKVKAQARKSIAWRLRPSERYFLLLAGDILSAGLALLAALYFWAERGNEWLHFSWEFLKTRPAFWFYLLPVAWVVLLVELYDIRRANRPRDTFQGVSVAVLASLAIYLPIFFVLPPKTLPRFSVAAFIIAAAILTLTWRMLYIKVFTAPSFMRRVLIVGAGKSGKALLHILDDLWPPPFFVVGMVDDDPQKENEIIGDYSVLGNSEHLLQVVKEECVSDIIFAISGEMSGNMFQSILDAEEQGVEVTTMPIFYEETLGRVPIFYLDSDWILRSFVDQAHASGIYEAIKRLIDIIGGLAGSLALLVILPFIAFAILIDTGFPVFFLQNRLGKNGKTYRIIKFRTMRKDSEPKGEVRVTTQNDDRITRTGVLLRKSHLDELPQFLNVLKGEMSLVGPRAERSELVTQLQKEIPFYRARLLVKPGITGWAQINFGYAATVEDTAVKLEYDLYYIKHRTLLMDIVIMLRTVGTVVGLRGQ
ncbi:MAG: sugar transferase [Anaerolineaceae bacterium]|nr:sugar transferase [Anaerolineaceae bacterium]